MANPKGNPETLKSFKPKWRSGKTQTIRVPIAIADQVLEAAKLIDEDQGLSTDTSGRNLDRIRAIATEAFEIKSNSGGAIKEAIALMLAELNITAVKKGRKWTVSDTVDLK